MRIDVSEIPCLSCLGALRQFQKAFPAVKLRLAFSIRKVSEVCVDLSTDPAAQLEACGTRRSADAASFPNNRGGRSQSAPPRRPVAQTARSPLPSLQTHKDSELRPSLISAAKAEAAPRTPHPSELESVPSFGSNAVPLRPILGSGATSYCGAPIRTQLSRKHGEYLQAQESAVDPAVPLRTRPSAASLPTKATQSFY